MKKLFYIVTLLALPLLSIAQTELKINTDIRGRNCSGGLGLCSVTSTLESKNPNQYHNTKAFKLNETMIILEFNKTMLSEVEQKSLLGLEFIQEEDLILDAATLMLLGIQTKYNRIKKGNYPMVITDNTIKVTFKLWER